MNLSVLMITKNNEKIVEDALRSVKGLADEILVDDDESIDRTVEIVKKYGGKILKREGYNLGERKQSLIEKAKGDWVLILDADERLSLELKKEIKEILLPRHVKRNFTQDDDKIVGYKIPYQNYVFGKPVNAGGENYSKVRLFRKRYGKIEKVPIHEDLKITGKIGRLKGKIHHHSYRNPSQLFLKFTRYAWIVSAEKFKQKEKITFSKLFLYGPNMFWARFIKDKGYRDGLVGLVLAKAFGYMEGLTYWFLLWRKLW